MTGDAEVFERIITEKIRVAAHARTDKEMIRRAVISLSRPGFEHQLIAKIETYMLGLADKRITIHKQWPKTWWDALKLRWFPRWLLEYMPVEYERIDIDEQIYKAVCPHIDVPDNRQHLEFFYHSAKTARPLGAVDETHYPSR